MIPYLAVNYQHLAIFRAKSLYHCMLLNKTIIMVDLIDKMWYQMIRNDENNNFLIENFSLNIYMEDASLEITAESAVALRT